MRRNHKLLLLLSMMLIGVLDVFGASVHLSVSTQRGQRTIGIGDVFYITCEVSNMDATPSQPSSIPGAKLLYFQRTGQSSSYTSVNGVTSQSRSVTYTLTAKAEKEGKFSFGPITVGGVTSNTVSYTIGKSGDKNSSSSNSQTGGGSQSSADPNSNKPKFIGKGDGNLFMRASCSKMSAYEQEALVYTVKLYTTYDGIKFIGATAAPKFEGFVVEESKATSTQLAYENYQGKTYATAVIARYIIFPQMKGSLKVIGNTYTVSVDQREYYHDPFWGNMSVSSPLQLNVTPNDLQINVKSLPQPQPADFSGGVGHFTISSSLPNTALLTNQGGSLIYTVRGSGNLKYLHLPDLNTLFPSEIEVYSPETEVKAEVGSTNVVGVAKFDYSIMPLETGKFSIPPLSLCYFNPETGRYERTSARGFTVTVGEGKSSVKSQTRNRLKFDSRLLPVTDNLSSEHSPWITMFGYWLVYIISIVILGGAVIIYRKHLKELSDIAGMKSKRAGKIARKRLRRAAECMKKNDALQFYTEMLRALWGYIAHKLKMPTSELTRENIRQRLEENHVPEKTIQEVIGLLDDCEYAQYTPTANSFNMKDLYEEATHVIYDLEDAFRSRSQGAEESEKSLMSISEKLDKELSDSKTLSKDVIASDKATDPTSFQEEKTQSIIDKDLND